MADYNQPAVVDKRVRFFDGQFLQDQDFIDEQKYHLDRERRLSRLLRVTGIAEGLSVVPGVNQVTVTPGMAVDGLGRHLVVAADLVVALPGKQFNQQQGVELSIIYQETPVDMATTGTKSQRRFSESPTVAAVAPSGAVAVAPEGASTTWDGPTVHLARLNVDATGAVTVDPTVPPAYAGLRLLGNVGVGTIDPKRSLHVEGTEIHSGGSGAGFSFADRSVGSFVEGPADGQRWVWYATDGTARLWSGGDTLSVTPQGVLALDSELMFTNPTASTVSSAGRMRIAGEERLYLLNKSGVFVGREWGGNGNLTVEGTLQAGDTTLEILTVNGDLQAGDVTLRANSKVTSPGRMHIAGEERLYLLNKSGVFVGREWGGNGNLTVEGNVGIGTTNPSSDLEIGNFDARDRYLTFKVRGENAYRSGLKLWAWQDNFGYSIEYDERAVIANGLHIKTHDLDADGTTRVFVARNGNVGIGTTDPGDLRLLVAGPAWVQGDLFVSGRLAYLWGTEGWKHIQQGYDNWARSYGTTGPPSDARLKTALCPIRDALQKVLQLHGVGYRWGDAGLEYLTRDISTTVSAGPGATEAENEQIVAAERRRAYAALSGENLGLVAQDVEGIVPEVVHEDDDGYKRIDYLQLVALLIEAIKEQHAAVQTLAGRVNVLATR